MAIASSTIIFQLLQADGKTRTRERHVTDAGTVVDVEYDAANGLDINAVMTARAAVIWQYLQDNECQSFIDLDIPPKFVNVTKAVLIAYVRQKYHDNSDGDLVKIARWILNRIADGTVTDTQVQNAFGLTSAQWTTLKTKMQSLISSDDAIQQAVGE